MTGLLLILGALAVVGMIGGLVRNGQRFEERYRSEKDGR